ncbi:MAG: hypothetical protein U0354_07795 [Candidatus Sericytochromatia bacterium]
MIKDKLNNLEKLLEILENSVFEEFDFYITKLNQETIKYLKSIQLDRNNFINSYNNFKVYNISISQNKTFINMMSNRLKKHILTKEDEIEFNERISKITSNNNDIRNWEVYHNGYIILELQSLYSNLISYKNYFSNIEQFNIFADGLRKFNISNLAKLSRDSGITDILDFSDDANSLSIFYYQLKSVIENKILELKNLEKGSNFYLEISAEPTLENFISIMQDIYIFKKVLLFENNLIEEDNEILIKNISIGSFGFNFNLKGSIKELFNGIKDLFTLKYYKLEKLEKLRKSGALSDAQFEYYKFYELGGKKNWREPMEKLEIIINDEVIPISHEKNSTIKLLESSTEKTLKSDNKKTGKKNKTLDLKSDGNKIKELEKICKDENYQNFSSLNELCLLIAKKTGNKNEYDLENKIQLALKLKPKDKKLNDILKFINENK